MGKTGRIVETLGNRQNQIKVDGSNRITLRNRRFLKKISPVADQIQPLRPATYLEPNTAQVTNDELPIAPAETTQMPASAKPSLPPPPLIAQHQRSDLNITSPMPPSSSAHPEPVPQAEVYDQPNHLPQSSRPTTGPQEQITSGLQGTVNGKDPDATSLRRSKRTPCPKRSLSPSMRGQRHNVVEQRPQPAP